MSKIPSKYKLRLNISKYIHNATDVVMSPKYVDNTILNMYTTQVILDDPNRKRMNERRNE